MNLCGIQNKDNKFLKRTLKRWLFSFVAILVNNFAQLKFGVNLTYRALETLMNKYKPAEHELEAVRNKLREYFPQLDIKDYEIRSDFKDVNMAYLYFETRQFRFEKKMGRWTCTRGIAD